MLRLTDIFDRLGERFGYIAQTGRRCIWVHGASVGEVGVAKLFIDELKARRPNLYFHISTNTQAGRRYAEKIFSPDFVSISYLPFDFKGCIARAFERARPMALVLVEQELWPNLISYAKARGVKVAIINGRITIKSALRYRRINWVCVCLSKIDLVLATSDQYAERFRVMGLANIITTGNMKYDINILPGINYKSIFGISEGDFVIVGGSTHLPEEEILVDVYKKLQGDAKNIRLIIAPRYLERLAEVEKIVASAGLKCYKRTKLEGTDGVIVVDTIGELADIYSVASVAFVGGSIASRGGHNLAEPAFWGKPILAGESLYNFSDLAERLEKVGALKITATGNSLYNQLLSFIKNPQECKRLGTLAKNEISKESGTIKRNVEEFLKIVNLS